MKRSVQLAAFLLVAAALTFTAGCRKAEMQRCVDQDLTVVDNDLCHATGEQRILGEKPNPSSNYHYYYGGTGSTLSGTRAAGGSFLREPDHAYEIAGQHKHLKLGLPLAIAVGFLAVLFFGWEGRNQRPN
jgi:hypothetical protein